MAKNEDLLFLKNIAILSSDIDKASFYQEKADKVQAALDHNEAWANLGHAMLECCEKHGIKSVAELEKNLEALDSAKRLTDTILVKGRFLTPNCQHYFARRFKEVINDERKD